MRRGSTSDPTVTEGCQACLVWIPGPAAILDPAEKEDPISAGDLNVAAAQTVTADLTSVAGLNAVADPNGAEGLGVAAVLLAVRAQNAAVLPCGGADPNGVEGLGVAGVLLAVRAQTVVVLLCGARDRTVLVDQNVVAAQIDWVRSVAQVAGPCAVPRIYLALRAQDVSSAPAAPKVALAASLLLVTNRLAAEQLMAAKFQFARADLLSASRHRHQVKWVGQFFLAYSHLCRADAQKALHQKDCWVSLQAAAQDHLQILLPVFEEY